MQDHGAHKYCIEGSSDLAEANAVGDFEDWIERKLLVALDIQSLEQKKGAMESSNYMKVSTSVRATTLRQDV